MTAINLDDEFPLDKSIVHLNHAGVGPWPRRTVDAVSRFARENMTHGSMHYKAWVETEQALRQLAADLINASSADDIAFLKNTSEALSLIAYGIDWQPGDEILLPPHEFPSNRIVWESLMDAHGVLVRVTSFPKGCDPEQALIDACTERTRLISVSSVNYATGLRLDLARVGRHCRANNILFCIDAIQSLGALPFDVQACHADFVAADGHKWMLAPEGVALFYCHPDRLAELSLTQFGWHMVEAMGAFDKDEWQPAATARRFECGSPNNMGIHGLKASLELIHEIGIDQVERAIHKNTHYLETELQALGFEIISATEAERRSGILCFRHPDRSSEALYNALMQAGVLCAYRGGGVRFSPHFYTPEAAMNRALEHVDQLYKNLK